MVGVINCKNIQSTYGNFLTTRYFFVFTHTRLLYIVYIVYLHCMRYVPLQCVFKPGARRPQAGVCLVS